MHAANEPGKLTVTFLYVGQGDCILLQSEGKSMLVDAGKAEYGSSVVKYLKSIGITYLDYAVVTHDDPDHIGGYNSVLKSIGVGQLFHTSKRYTDNVNSSNANKLIDSLNIPVDVPVAGTRMNLGCATIEFIAPNGDLYKEYNDNSIVMRVVNGNNSFLLTGDAELASEQEMMAKGYTLKSDVLKVGHHSALTSTSQEFLNMVDPSISVISCDEAGAAGFPRLRTIAKLTKTNIYRTDISGNIVFESDGSTITTEQDPYFYANSDFELSKGVITRTLEKESALLKNETVTSDYDEITLQDLAEDDDYSLMITEPLQLHFEAEAGISRISSIEYALVPSDEQPDVDEMEWNEAQDGDVTLTDDFVGNVYVKFENELGNVVIRKTTGFLLDCTVPAKCKVTSNFSNLSLIKTSEANTYKRYTKDDSYPELTFSCNYGISGKGSVEYMLVERGETFDEDDIWEDGNTAVIKKNFIGRVYVRFTDGAGNQVIYKTQGFTWISGKPINVVMASNIDGVKLLSTSQTAKKLVANKPVTLSFTADFGHGGRKAIRYQLVPYGKKYNGKGKWVTSSKVNLKKGFAGTVYVKFVDMSGRSLVKKTNYIRIPKSAR